MRELAFELASGLARKWRPTGWNSIFNKRRSLASAVKNPSNVAA